MLEGLQINPAAELTFTLQPTKTTLQADLIISHSGKHADPIAFKIKTTCPRGYVVRPNLGLVRPGQSVGVQVLMVEKYNTQLWQSHARLGQLTPDSCLDKFLVQAMRVMPDDEVHPEDYESILTLFLGCNNMTTETGSFAGETSAGRSEIVNTKLTVKLLVAKMNNPGCPPHDPSDIVRDRRSTYSRGDDKTHYTLVTPGLFPRDEEDIEFHDDASRITSIINPNVAGGGDLFVDAMFVPESGDFRPYRTLILKTHQGLKETQVLESSAYTESSKDPRICLKVRGTVELPKTFVYRQNDDETEIYYNNKKFSYQILAVIMVYAPFGNLQIIAFQPPPGLTRYVIFNCMLVVFAIFAMFNSIIITITPDQVKVRNRVCALCCCSKTFSLSPETVREIRCKKYTLPDKKTVLYQVEVVRQQEHEIPDPQCDSRYDVVIAGLQLPEEALFVEQEIERALAASHPIPNTSTYSGNFTDVA